MGGLRGGCRAMPARANVGAGFGAGVKKSTLLKPSYHFYSAHESGLATLSASCASGAPTMAISSKARKPNGASKTSRPITLKHLAATLAEEHQLTKRAGEAAISLALSQSILRRANESVLRASVSCKVRKRAA